MKMPLNRKIFVVFIITLLTLPILGLVGLKDPTVIHGAIPTIVAPSLKNVNFKDGTFQKEIEQWWKSTFFAKQTLVKIRNQIYEWINWGDFHAAQGVVGGIDSYIFTIHEINAFYGVFQKPNFEELHKQLRIINDFANRKSIPIIFILGSSKVRVYKEKIPKYIRFFEKKEFNITDSWKKMLTSVNMPFLDSYIVAENLKNNFRIEPYPITGHHWGQYQAAKVTQLVASKLKLPNLFIDSYEYVDKPTYFGERDLTDTLNLFLQPNTNIRYQKISLSAPIEQKYKVTLLGDSYAHSINGPLIQTGILDEKFDMLFSNNIPTNEDVNKIFKHSDCIIFIACDTTLTNSTHPLQLLIKKISNWILKQKG